MDSLKTTYWNERRNRLVVPNGKQKAVLQTVSLIAQMKNIQGVSLLELGCGSGDIISQIQKVCISRQLQIRRCVGIDKDEYALQLAKDRKQVNIQFMSMDYTSEDLHHIGKFDIVILVNSLHEVFSSRRKGTFIDIDSGKEKVKQTLTHIAKVLNVDGYLLIFDGVEHAHAENLVHFTLLSEAARKNFRRFVEEYQGLKTDFDIDTEKIASSLRDFTRYITKIIFLDSPTWEIEKYESYQYYTREEFYSVLKEIGFKNIRSDFYSPSQERWHKDVKLLSPNAQFPDQHLLLVCQRSGEI